MSALALPEAPEAYRIMAFRSGLVASGHHFLTFEVRVKVGLDIQEASLVVRVRQCKV